MWPSEQETGNALELKPKEMKMMSKEIGGRGWSHLKNEETEQLCTINRLIRVSESQGEGYRNAL